MVDSMISCVIICVVCFPSLVAGKTSISFDPVKTPLTESVDITCTLTESSSTTVTWNFGSTTTSCGSGTCSPNPITHTFSMSGNVFTLTLPSAAIGNCVSYSCADALNNADTTSKDLSVAYFDKADIVPTEPGANTDGTISVTTGCVLSPSDLTITWSKIQKGKNEEVFTAVRPSPIDTSDRSTCTRTCHSEEDKKVTHGFNHKEFTGDGSSVEVQYKVTVTHNSYPDASDQYTWTSATYKLEADCTCECKCKCKNMVFASIAIGIAGAITLLIVVGGTVKECIGRKTALVVDSIGILCGVTSFVLGIVVQAIDCCEDCCEDSDCCECERNWVENTGAAFIAIGALVGIAGGVIFYRVWFGRMGPGNNGGNGFFCFNNGNDDGNDGGNDSGNNGHHRGRGTNSSTVHTERTDTHRGTLSDRRPMPPIPLTDNKGRGLSANYDDDDHPMISVGIPEKKKGDLGPLEEEPKKKKKKKKKAVNDDDNV